MKKKRTFANWKRYIMTKTEKYINTTTIINYVTNEKN